MWKTPHRWDLLLGEPHATAMHVESVAGPQPEIIKVRGRVKGSRKGNFRFVSSDPLCGLEFEVSGLKQLEIWTGSEELPSTLGERDGPSDKFAAPARAGSTASRRSLETRQHRGNQ